MTGFLPLNRRLDQIFNLIDAGHIKPIRPIGFNDIPAALTYIRSGRHIGKFVVSNRDKGDIQVLIKPAVRKPMLRANAPYLVVGGLKGLCGNLAVYMAQYRFRSIIICSRSGISDEASKKTIKNCLAYRFHILEAKGDSPTLNFREECSRRTGSLVLSGEP